VLRTLLLALAAGASADLDRDQLPDDLEAKLIARFQPRFFLSGSDCDGLPSEFTPNTSFPKSKTRNGTLYAQAFPVRDGIEIHYYHLWARDCGRISHPLDAEHVSVLIDASTHEAKLWFAAAHQNTPCDSGTGARADTLNAVTHGPLVYISAGKHASYFSPASCEGGCGGDRCDNPTLWKPTQVINLGEPGAPLNGATWAQSPLWTLRYKMHAEFTPEVRETLSSHRGIATVSRTPAPVIHVLAAGNTAITESSEALATGQSHTGDALATATDKTKSSLKRATQSTRSWLRRRLGLP
jgi:hypothetical protein